MKIITKLKNILISVGITIMALPKKVYGSTAAEIYILGNEYAPELYGLPETEHTINIFLNILRIFIIPLSLIIGIIIYWKKSKKPTKTKIIKIVIAILIAAGLIGLILLCQYLFF